MCGGCYVLLCCARLELVRAAGWGSFPPLVPNGGGHPLSGTSTNSPAFRSPKHLDTAVQIVSPLRPQLQSLHFPYNYGEGSQHRLPLPFRLAFPSSLPVPRAPPLFVVLSAGLGCQDAKKLPDLGSTHKFLCSPRSKPSLSAQTPHWHNRHLPAPIPCHSPCRRYKQKRVLLSCRPHERC